MLAKSNRLTSKSGETGSFYLTAYRALKESKNVEAAHEWIRQQIPDEAVLEMMAVAFQAGDYDLMAEIAAPRVVARKNDEVETYESMALTALHVPTSDPRWAPILEHLRTSPVNADSLTYVTRYLANLIDEATFLKNEARSPDWRISVFYIVGLKKAAGGDYDRAVPFLLAACEYRFGHPPQAWAETMLRRWSLANASWEEIKKRRLL